MKSKWELLGIERTEDIKRIKKAFLERSKDVHPEEDAEAFLELKNAYESAIFEAKTMSRYKSYVFDIPQTINIQETNEETESSYLRKLIESNQTSNDFHAFFSNYSSMDKLFISRLDLELSIDDILSAITEFDDAKESKSHLTEFSKLQVFYEEHCLKEIINYLTLMDSFIKRVSLEVEDEERDLLKKKCLEVSRLINILNIAISKLDEDIVLYLNSGSDYNDDQFEQLFLFALDKYRDEADEYLKYRYYQLIMLHELCRSNQAYEKISHSNKKYELSLSYFTYRNDFFDLAKDIEFDKVNRNESEVLEKHTHISFYHNEYSYYQYMKASKNNDKLIFNPDYFKLQKDLIRDYLIRFMIDPTTSMSEIENLVFKQWKHWSAHIGEVNRYTMSTCQLDYVHPLIYLVINDLTSASFWKLRRKEDQYLFSYMDTFISELKSSYTLNNKLLVKTSDSDIQKISQLVQLALDVYQSAKAAVVLSDYHIEDQPYLNLISKTNIDRNDHKEQAIFMYSKRTMTYSDLNHDYVNDVPIREATSAEKKEAQRRRSRTMIYSMIIIAIIFAISVLQDRGIAKPDAAPSVTIGETKEKDVIRVKEIDQEKELNNLRIINDYLSEPIGVAGFVVVDGEVVKKEYNSGILTVLFEDTKSTNEKSVLISQFNANPTDKGLRLDAINKRERILTNKFTDVIRYAIEIKDYNFIHSDLCDELGLTEELFDEWLSYDFTMQLNAIKELRDHYIEEKKLNESES